MKIESTDQDIRTMLSSGYYRIPRFQRPYSWDRENIQEFWDDIVRDNPPDYFIGSMVVYKDDAYIIFETLNTRGKDLSLTDLVKNHLTKHIKSKNPASDQAKIKWQQLLETIEGSSADLDTDTFIHHFWLSKYDYLPAKNLFKVLKKIVGVNDAPGFLDALLEDAALYRAIHEVGYGKWAKEEGRIQQGLSALMLFRVQQQTPCVLSLLWSLETCALFPRSTGRQRQDVVSRLARTVQFESAWAINMVVASAELFRVNGGLAGEAPALQGRVHREGARLVRLDTPRPLCEHRSNH